LQSTIAFYQGRHAPWRSSLEVVHKHLFQFDRPTGSRLINRYNVTKWSPTCELRFATAKTSRMVEYDIQAEGHLPQ
jgi:hypothetical protein